MTEYEQLAADMVRAGTKDATLGGAYRLAMRAWRGEAMTDREAGLVGAWEARTAGEPWNADVARQRGNGA